MSGKAEEDATAEVGAGVGAEAWCAAAYWASVPENGYAGQFLTCTTRDVLDGHGVSSEDGKGTAETVLMMSFI